MGKDIGIAVSPLTGANNRENDAVNLQNAEKIYVLFCLEGVGRTSGRVFEAPGGNYHHMETNSAASVIRGLLDSQAAAVSNRDIATATANYASDVVIFDVVGPLQHPKGDSSVRKRLEEWMSTFADHGPVLFEITDPIIEASGDHGFSYSLNRVQATLRSGGILDMYWRETLGWRRTGSEWKIVHAHSSVPFNPSTGMASTGLKPD